MKNTILYLSILFLAIACNDPLQENPKAIATANFYSTVDEIESGVLGIYAPIKTNECFGARYPGHLESCVDYGYGRGSYAPLSAFQGLDPTNIGRTEAMWSRFYTSIRNANTVIKKAGEATSLNEAEVNALIGEARFLRAFCYFHLVRNFGAVPLRTPENSTDESLPRTPANDIYDYILQDLDFAQNNLPNSVSIPGRATKWAAKTLLADVHLELGNWSNARSLSLEVINSGNYSLIDVSVPDDFYKIFGPKVISSSEEIFYLKYNATNGLWFAYWGHHSGDPYLNGAGYYALYTDSVNNKIIRDWDYKDLRKSFNVFYWNIGLGPTTMLYKKYIDPERTENSQGDFPIYRLADVLLLYAEADCRANNGPTSDGLEKLNMVHRRAYGHDPTVASPVDFKLADYNADSFVDLVMTERMYETFQEGKRWHDLKRTGKVKAAIKEAYGIDVADSHLLWPIPIAEYSYNPAIDPETDQNPGY